MMNKSAQGLPQYLRRYCMEQDYDRYTPREHATWRYIMRQSRSFFAEHAVESYTEGLRATGIPTEHIPRINEIDEHLQKLGWGAVGVSGFIPPAAFLDFQARGIMPIAMDMRTLEHLAYTPAPDIVHEAAGHVPLIVDPAYRRYLARYANMAKKAIISQDDVNLYEAIRLLSDIKENPDTKPEELKAAHEKLEAASSAVKEVSELAKVARMNWWTAEYGLVGSLSTPKIYGAGLLSSVGESHHCLSPAVRKIPLSLECVATPYDITEPQPQLFVAESLAQLPDVLESLDRTLSYRVGGSASVNTGLRAQSVSTVVWEQHLSVSGVIDEVICDAKGQVEFLKFRGPVQLAENEQELPGQGRQRHPQGFSSPFGRWKKKSNRACADLSDSDLSECGVIPHQRVKLEYSSGFVVEGTVSNWCRVGSKLMYITFSNAKVTRGDKVFFDPSWGSFDLALGESVISVHGGPADREMYGSYDLGTVSSSPGRQTPFSSQERENFAVYAALRDARDLLSRKSPEAKKSVEAVVANVCRRPDSEWLMALEAMELEHAAFGVGAHQDELKRKLGEFRGSGDKEKKALIDQGLELVDQAG